MSKRNLSLIGKIHIVKTFGLSQLVFIMKSIAIPRKVLEDVNTLFFKFVWKKQLDNKKAFEKIKRNVLCNDYLNGGLRMIDIRHFQDSILLEWAHSFITSSVDSPWADVAATFFSRLGGKNVFKSHTTAEDFRGGYLIISSFWRTVLMRWLKYSKLSSTARPFSNFDPICNNSNITLNNNTLFLPSSIDRGAVTVNDVMRDNRLITLIEYRDKFGEYPRCILDYYAISNALREVSRHINFNGNANFYFGDHSIDKLERKSFYNIIRQQGEPLCISRWKRQYNVDITKIHWTIVHDIKETKLRALIFKVLHNIYPTNILLFKMKLAESQNCKLCGEMDFIEHFFFNCAKVKPLWIEIGRDISVALGVIYKIVEKDVILGVQDIEGLSKKDLKQINLWIAIGKLVVSKFRYGKTRNIIEIYETECRLRKLKL